MLKFSESWKNIERPVQKTAAEKYLEAWHLYSGYHIGRREFFTALADYNEATAQSVLDQSRIVRDPGAEDAINYLRRLAARHRKIAAEAPNNPLLPFTSPPFTA